MKRILLLIVFLTGLARASLIDPLQDPYLNRNMNEWMKQIFIIAHSSPHSAETAVLLSELIRNRDLIPDRSCMISNFLLVADETTNNFLSFMIREELAFLYLSEGEKETALKFFSTLGLMTQWKASPPVILSGRRDLDLSVIPGTKPELKIPPLAITGIISPFRYFYPDKGLITLESWFYTGEKGPHKIKVQGTSSFTVQVDDHERIRNDLYRDEHGRDIYLSVFLEPGWHRLVLRIISEGSRSDLLINVLNQSWEQPAGWRTSDFLVQKISYSDEPKIILPSPEKELKKRTALYSADLDDYFLFGLWALQDGRTDLYVREIEKCLKKQEKETFLLDHLVSVLLTSGEHRNSSRLNFAASSLADQKSSQTGPLLTLARVYEFNDRKEDALNLFQKAYKNNQDNFLTSYYLARHFYSRNWKAEFKETINSCLSDFPGFGYALRLLVKFQALSVPGNRIRTIEKIIRTDHLSSQRIDLIKLLKENGQYSEALKQTEILSSFYPGLLESRLEKAQILYRAKKPDQALAILNSLAETTPGLPLIMKAQSEIYLLTGHTEEALQIMEQIIRIDPSLRSLQDEVAALKGDVHYSLDQYMPVHDMDRIIKKNVGFDRTGSTAGSVILDDHEVLKINSDGTWYRQVHQLILLRDKNGIERWANSSIDYQPDMRIIKASVHLADGKELDLQNLRRQGNRYVLSFPSVEPGAILELKYLISGKWNRVKDTHYFYSHTRIFRVPNDDINRISYTVVYPKNLDFSIVSTNLHTLNKLTVREQEKGPDHVITLQAPLAPALVQEPNTPSLAEIVPSFHVVRFPRERFSEWYLGLFDLMKSSIPEVDNLLFALSNNSSMSNTGLNLIRSLYNWVNENIEVDGSWIYSPSPLRKIIDQKSGTTENRTWLLKKLLERMDIHTDILLLRTSDMAALSPNGPDPSWFNDLLLRLDWKGETWLLDLSDRSFNFGEYGWDRYNCLAYSPEKKTWQPVPALPFKEDGFRLKYTGSISEKKDLLIKGQRSFLGSHAVYREMFLDPISRKSVVHQVENHFMPGTTASNIEFYNLEKRTGPFSYMYEGIVQNWIGKEGLPLPGKRSALGERFISGNERILPLKIYTPLIHVQKINLDLQGAEPKLPDDIDLITNFGKFRITYQFISGHLLIETELSVPQQTVQPEYYRDFKNFCMKVDRLEEEKIRLSWP